MATALVDIRQAHGVANITPSQEIGHLGLSDITAGLNLPKVSNLTWDGCQFQDEAAYVLTFSREETQEIDLALRGFLDLNINGEDINQDNFVLPTTADRLRNLALELHNGKGFFVLRGLNPDAYSQEENILIYLGISSYVGEKRGRQDDSGNIIAHLKTLIPAGSVNISQSDRPLKFSNRMAEFHNDIGCDILAMQTLDVPTRGGNHLLASAATILKEMSITHPDLAKELMSPTWPHDLRRRWAQSTTQSVFHIHDGRILSTLMPDALFSPPDIARTKGLPQLCPLKMEAIRVVQEIATRTCLRIQCVRGDIIFVNNFALVHGRDAFDESLQASRYLVRLWLRSNCYAWSLPPAMRVANYMVFDDDILPEVWNIHPMEALKFEVYERMTP